MSSKSTNKDQDLDYENLLGQVEAISRSQSVIEFELDGTVVSANENFLSMMGYGLDEIVGQHHSIFADPDFAASAEYKEFGAALGRGEYQAAEFKRLGKNGREVWIQATYNPIFDRDGNPFKFVKFATDITEESVSNANHAGQINAINKSQSVIEFELDGTVLSANENFLSIMGYGLDEIVGQHHSIFADPDFAASAEYKEFGAALGRGEYQAAEFKRLGKNGREVWIQASYNPIFDRDGNPYKVVKFATDVTERKAAEALIDSQRRAIVEMSTPVTSIWAGVLMLPLVGVIDSKRAQDITARILEDIASSEATCFILDISGVAIIDTAVANYLIKITKATRLMGCKSLISGLSPAIAQTIADLGIDVGDVQTTGQLSDALRLAFDNVGITVSNS